MAAAPEPWSCTSLHESIASRRVRQALRGQQHGRLQRCVEQRGMQDERVLLLRLVVGELDFGDDLTVAPPRPPHALERGAILEADLLQAIVELVDVDFGGVVVGRRCLRLGAGRRVRG